MCNEAFDDYVHALQFVPDCFKTQKVGNKAVNTNPSTMHFVPEYYKSQEMCDKAAHTFFVLYKTQEMCDSVLSKDHFLLNHCLNGYKTHVVWWNCLGLSVWIKKFFWLV